MRVISLCDVKYEAENNEALFLEKSNADYLYRLFSVKGTANNDANWTENANNVNIFLFVGLVWLRYHFSFLFSFRYQYLCNKCRKCYVFSSSFFLSPPPPSIPSPPPSVSPFPLHQTLAPQAVAMLVSYPDLQKEVSVTLLINKCLFVGRTRCEPPQLCAKSRRL